MEKTLTENQRKVLAKAVAYYLDKHIWNDTAEHEKENDEIRKVILELDLVGDMPENIRARF